MCNGFKDKQKHISFKKIVDGYFQFSILQFLDSIVYRKQTSISPLGGSYISSHWIRILAITSDSDI